MKVVKFLNKNLVAWPGRSAVAGVGLMALRPIAAGEAFLEEKFAPGDRVNLGKKEIKKLPPFVASFIAERFPTSGRELQCHTSLADGMLHYTCFCYMFLNRADKPNTKFVVKKNRQYLVATENIPAGGEIFTDDYNLEMCRLDYYL